ARSRATLGDLRRGDPRGLSFWEYQKPSQRCRRLSAACRVQIAGREWVDYQRRSIQPVAAHFEQKQAPLVLLAQVSPAESFAEFRASTPSLSFMTDRGADK